MDHTGRTCLILFRTSSNRAYSLVALHPTALIAITADEAGAAAGIIGTQAKPGASRTLILGIGFLGRFDVELAAGPGLGGLMVRVTPRGQVQIAGRLQPSCTGLRSGGYYSGLNAFTLA